MRISTMLRFSLLSLLTLTVGLESAVAFQKPRLLMVSQSKGYRHASVTREGELISPAEKAMKKIAARTGLFDIDFSQDSATHLTKENLQNYTIVVFYTSGDLPMADRDRAYLFEEWVKQPGHGFIGFHSATDTYKDYPIYWDFIGGTFNGHPWTQNSEVTITVHDPKHAAVRPFGSELIIKEEIYQYINWQPEKVRVLMSLDMAKTDLKRPYHVPVAWAKQIGKGRMFYTNLGHRPDTWENKQFIASIEGAVQWVLGEAEGETKPNPEISQQQEDLSREASHAAGVTLESLKSDQRK